MTASTLLPDHTPVEAVVAAPRSIKALRDAGFETLGEVREAGIEKVGEVRYVGPSALEALREQIAGPSTAIPEANPGPKEEDFVEGPHPVILHSPHNSLRLAWSPARKITHPDGSYQVQDTLFIEFGNGKARISREAFLLRKYNRDEQQVARALEQNEPWRRECIAIVRAMRSYEIDFFLLDD